MSVLPAYVDVARFDPVDRVEVIAATFVCPWCLLLPSAGRIRTASDGTFVELGCAGCDARWTVVVDSRQLLRLLLAPPPDIVLGE
jgi:hypothetical protein